jgi:drug/metabolite transporter (DMT)-like permease
MIAPVAVWGATDSGFCAMDGSFSVNFNIVDNIERFSSVRNWANLAFLGAVASAAGFALWNCACKGLGVVKATVLLYLVPVAGVVFAVGFLGESVAPMGIAGGVLIVAGVAVAGCEVKKEVGQ